MPALPTCYHGTYLMYLALPTSRCLTTQCTCAVSSDDISETKQIRLADAKLIIDLNFVHTAMYVPVI